ncbi:alkaline phosphatase [Chitinophaga sedimenti]|uniref:alkaline phosphatase n=1 Tax=Chitinophaga sedimenti TaxID=2033606 RepID=UPI00249EB839|nr:alkaline phosphatase [Chitinophaga sedimenti]
MTSKAIAQLNRNKRGFVMQVEGGKVDWAAHSNDAGALLYDQLAFDEAVGVALEFAKKDGSTLVIITTDHGNANPGLFTAIKPMQVLIKYRRLNTRTSGSCLA